MRALPDFDQLRNLAQNDPYGLDQLRQEYINDAIASAKPENRKNLTALQCHVDRTLSRASNPYHGLVQVMSLMQDKLYNLSRVLNDPDEFLSNNAKVLCLQESLPPAQCKAAWRARHHRGKQS